MEKLARYIDFDGDIDKWILSQKEGLDPVLTGGEWEQIEKTVQRLKFGKNQDLSLDYRNETERVLKQNFENDEVIKAIRDFGRPPR